SIFYKKLLDQVPDLIFCLTWDEANSYQIVFLSETITELYEISTENFMKDTDLFFRDRLVEEDKERFREEMEYSRATLKKWSHEYRITLPKKGLRWMKLSAKPELEDDGKIYFYGRVSDITEQKEQEHLLQLSEERYKFALKAASEGIWDWDIVNDEVYFSAQSMKIIGKEEKEA